MFGKPTRQKLIEDLVARGRIATLSLPFRNANDRYRAWRHHALVTLGFSFAVWQLSTRPTLGDDDRKAAFQEWLDEAHEKLLAGLSFSEIEAVLRLHRRRQEWNDLGHLALQEATFAVPKVLDLRSRKPLLAWQTMSSDGAFADLLEHNTLGAEDSHSVWWLPFLNRDYNAPAVDHLTMARTLKQVVNELLFKGLATSG